jgi:8-oxo-dGTP pyrophosphatase MutT (NUDIX family)
MVKSREEMLAVLRAYAPEDQAEREMLSRMVEFVATHDDCFDRRLAIGHMTGSAWVVDREREHALLTHHRKLDRWLQVGGHADGNADLLEVAMREAREESGLCGLRAVSETPFDVDIHEIPERGTEPRHLHYDVRYLLEADHEEPLVVSEESHALAWVPLRELAGRADLDRSLQRMTRKILDLQN